MIDLRYKLDDLTPLESKMAMNKALMENIPAEKLAILRWIALC